MRFIPPIELDPRVFADRRNDRGSSLPGDRLVELTSWMLVLGTIRLTCALADYAGTVLEAFRSQPITFKMVSVFTQENQPLILLFAAWPLLFSIALRRTRWPELLPAAAATFLILSIGGLIEFIAELNQARAFEITIGSFHLTRRAFLRPTLSDVVLGMLGATQLLFELAVAARALLLIPAFRGMHALDTTKSEQARRARSGRLAVYTSIGFLVLMIRLPVWSTYLELLDHSPMIRAFVLRNDVDRLARPRNFFQLSKAEIRLRDMRFKLLTANDAAATNRFDAAEETYLQLIAQADSDAPDLPPQNECVIAGQALNGLAWMHATCPDTSRRNPERTVRLARRAVELQPDDGNIWNTLGVACYRAGLWQEAKSALERSMDRRNQGDSFDWFFLALVELKLGHRERALEWYGKAVARFHQFVPNDRELYRFHDEAAEELKLPRPAPPPPAPSVYEPQSTVFPIDPSSGQRHLRSKAAVPSPRPGSR
jgi:tetratricopeptide (TPR) repeat protein